ncbi:macro domain-containing protein [Lachnoanaerobaculum sp.]
MPFKIIKNDITKVKADAIVNTVNPNAIIGEGVEYAIYNAAGKDELLKAREKLGYMPSGEVGITPAFKLDAKYIIHVSSPVWTGGWYGERPPESVFTKETILLGDCYMKALYMAAENGCKSIAFPLLATGAYKFPKEIGMAVAVRAFTEFLKNYDMEIFLVVFGRDSFNISGSLFRKVKKFVDHETICAEFVPLDDSDWIDGSTIDDLDSFDDGNSHNYKNGGMESYWSIEEDDEETESYRNLIEDDGALYYEIPSGLHKSPESRKHPKSLEESLKKIHKYSFAGYLQQLINKKGMKNSEVYATANITKQYFSKLINGKVNPSKEKVIALAIGLHLNMDETKDILKIAGYAFSPYSQTDIVVKYFINNKDYNVIKLDILLYDFGLDPISS